MRPLLPYFRMSRFYLAPVVAPALACLLACPPTSAQYNAAKITFKDPGSFQQKDLEAVAGLHAGVKTSVEGIQAAAQQLIDTGYFDDVKVDTQGSPSALNVIFILKSIDPARLSPAGFENFVWLTPEELATTVRKAAPLFESKLPDAGNQMDAITNALQAALVAKGVSATIVHETLEPSTSQPFRAIEFRVDQPMVRIHAIKLEGVSPEMADAENKIATMFRDSRYSEGMEADTTAETLLGPYRNGGYLDAKLNGLSRTVAETTPAGVKVDITATLDAGQPYRVSAIDFAETPLITSAAVMNQAKLHPGDIASRKQLLETLKPIDAAYRRQGYVDVFVDPGAKLNPATHTVSYSIQVTPGEQYHLRTVTPLNLPPSAQQEFDAKWQMKPGKLYNPQYASDFLSDPNLHALFGYTASFQAVADPQTHLVDLTIKFVRGNR